MSNLHTIPELTQQDEAEVWQKGDNGRPPKFKTPDELRDKINEYFQYCLDNPLQREEIVKVASTRTVERKVPDPENPEETITETVTETIPYQRVRIDIPRAFTLEGMAVYCGITFETVNQYGKKPGFSEVIAHARNISKAVNIPLAAAGLINANLIARYVGLIERKDITTGGKDIAAPIQVEIIENE